MSSNYDESNIGSQDIIKYLTSNIDYFSVMMFKLYSILALFIIWSMYRSFRPLPLPKSLPGPKSHQLLGILPHVIKHWEDWPYEVTRLSKKYGKTWGGGVPNVTGLNGAFFFLIDEANIRHILSDNFENYVKGPAFRLMYGDLLGVGIFASDGEVWKAHRKLMSNMFSRNLLRKTAEVTLQKLHLIEGIFQCNVSNGTSVDLQDIFFRMTFDTTSFMAFGCNINSLQAKDGQHTFATAFDEMQFLVNSRCTDPFFRIKRLLGLGYREIRIASLKKIISHEVHKIIGSRKDSADEDGSDLLGRILNHDKINQILTDDELCDFVINIFIAGRDTTACAISWAFYELTKYPLVIQKIIQEAEQICGAIGNVQPNYSYDNICKLRYTHAVVMEVLRLHPPVPTDHKYALKNDILPDGTFIPSGAAVSWIPIAMGRSEKIWGDDALEFNPDRFLTMKEPSLFKYPVFNAGPRTCLGKPLALMTIKLTLAFLLPRFNFVDKVGHSGACNWKMVLAMRDGFLVDITEKL